MARPIIRVVQAEDVEAIGRLWLDLVAYHVSLDESFPRPSDDGAKHYAERILNRLHDETMRVVVAVVDGEIIGYVLGVVVDTYSELFVTQRSGFVADIFVAEAYRQQGVGRDLALHLIDWFKAQSVEFYELYVSEVNGGAVKFWEDLQGRTLMRRMRANIGDD